MELLELTNRMMGLFGVSDHEKLRNELLFAAHDGRIDKLDGYVDLVSGDLTTDYLQQIYQYYMADRKVNKQDYTPGSLAELAGALIGGSEYVIDMCAGTGALTIKRWLAFPNSSFDLYEIDENVVPYLLFNMVVRNIHARIFVGDVLRQETKLRYVVSKGERYGKVASF